MPGAIAAPPRPLLRAAAVSKSFVGNRVLADVDLEIRPGEVHALVGENGAGKSTLIKILGGVHRPDAGQVLIDEQARPLRSPRDALAAGVVVIHQELSLAPDLSAEENVFLGRFPRKTFIVDRTAMRSRTKALFDQLGVAVAPQQRVGSLSIGQQQMVEIAKAISVEARVLVLDEPTAVLDNDRVEILFATVRRLKAKGLGVLFISHHLEEIFEIADRVTVLRDGRVTGSSPVNDIDQEWLIAKMIGRQFAPHAARARQIRNPALAIKGLTAPGEICDVSLSIHEGEIVGLAGLVGAGRTELARAVIGLARPVAGAIELFGRTVKIASPADAFRLGLAYVTEDRKSQGLLPNRPVRENIAIANLRRFTRAGVLNRASEARYVRQAVKSLDLRLAGVGVEIRTLSGGNQQKALVGRALATQPRVLLLDEPTRGVDIGAKQEIYELIEKLVGEGMAIMLISSDMEEILRLSDRIVVMRQGRVAATLSRAEASETAIMRAAALAG